jgi:hypothetical protein
MDRKPFIERKFSYARVFRDCELTALPNMSGHVTQLTDAIVVAHTHTTTDDLTTLLHFFGNKDHAECLVSGYLATKRSIRPGPGSCTTTWFL